MELSAISVFVKVVQTGSFSGAAKLLGMPNTTVSAKVAQLEKRLGVTLIQRTTRKLNVTQAGEAYFRRCAQALEEIRSVEAEITHSQDVPRGHLRITAATDVGHTLLPPIVHAFMKKHPEVTVELIITNRVVDLVGEGVDIGLRAGELEDSTLLGKKLVSSEFGVMAAPAYLKKHGVPQHPRDLESHDLLQFSDIPDIAILHRRDPKKKETVKLKLQGRLKADDLETLKKMALFGQGIALVPTFLCTEEIDTGKLVHLLKDWKMESGSFTAVYPAQKFIPAKVRAFIEVAAEEIKNVSR